MENILNQVSKIVIEYGPKLVGAIFVWIIGSWVIKIIMKGFVKMLNKRNTDVALKPFLRGTVGTLLKVLLAISVLGMLGIEMTSFIAILGAAGLAIGMALSGTLQNFAGGVIILIIRPFNVGDLIKTQDYLGKVDKIHIFHTVLKTLDNKTIIIPNGELSNSSLTNYTAEPKRRIDWTFGIAYGDDVDKAKSVIKRLCEEDERILPEPEVIIAVSELADSSVNIATKAWVNTGDYWDVFFAMNEKIYKSFNKEGLNIPFPQMDVHLDKS